MGNETYADHNAYGWHVIDPDGGVWWPSDQARKRIEAHDDPAAEATRLATTDPMMGEWRS